MKYVTHIWNYLAFCKDIISYLKRPEEAMSMANTILRNTSWIKIDKDMLFYYFKVGDHFYNCEKKKKIHISTKIKGKHTPHEDMHK